MLMYSYFLQNLVVFCAEIVYVLPFGDKYVDIYIGLTDSKIPIVYIIKEPVCFDNDNSAIVKYNETSKRQKTLETHYFKRVTSDQTMILRQILNCHEMLKNEDIKLIDLFIRSKVILMTTIQHDLEQACSINLIKTNDLQVVDSISTSGKLKLDFHRSMEIYYIQWSTIYNRLSNKKEIDVDNRCINPLLRSEKTCYLNKENVDISFDELSCSQNKKLKTEKVISKIEDISKKDLEENQFNLGNSDEELNFEDLIKQYEELDLSSINSESDDSMN
ncbi:uncharacterized protein VNE69_12001 [Vairimorpha necatrix]|uniref:Uncharacterized protein n=1 Tax=Vairimorpha necatrix TaxID=6039 RepID=A0AAX4JGV3_9MICR